MRPLSTLLSAALVGGLVATLVPAAPAAAAPVVPAPLFGQHVTKLSSGAPRTLTRVGAVRLWDSGVSWRQVELANNRYSWGKLDAAVRNAERLGAREILYTLGSTPAWAASNPKSKLALYGPGSNTHPKSNRLYTDYLTALVKRYGTRITAYQVWNEANLREFYLGTPTQMATLTRDARATLRRLKSPAKLVAASTTVRPKGPVGKFGKAYGKAMKKAGWPVDVVSAHFYPPAKEGPATRVRYIKVIRKYYRTWGARSKPIWDTEMSYGDTRPYMKIRKTYTGGTAATYVARTYLDSMRYGISRVFWYGWDTYQLGTDMTTRDRRAALTAGGWAFLTIQDWMVGKQWLGCRTKSKVTTCTLRSANGALTRIKYSTKGTRTVKVPAGATRLSMLNGTTRVVAPGSALRLGTQPVAFR